MDTGTPVQWMVTLALVAAALAWFWPRAETWTGVIYPDRGNLIDFEALGVFETLEACRAAVSSKIRDLENPASADWECGLNCRPSESIGDLMICEETER